MDVSQTGRRSGRASGRRGLLIGLGLGIVLTGGGMTLLSRTSSCQAAPNPPAKVAGQSVSVALVQVTAVTRTADATGSVAADDLLPILPEATGLQIQQVLTDEGQSVRAGKASLSAMRSPQ